MIKYNSSKKARGEKVALPRWTEYNKIQQKRAFEVKNLVSAFNYVSKPYFEPYFESFDFDQIFLATDDSEAIEVFANKFGDKLVYYKDVIRTSGDETVMKSTVDRPLHHYNLGIEVIRDSYTLSLCSGLIAGLSNVSIFSRLMKQSEGKRYDYLKILDKGIKQV